MIRRNNYIAILVLAALCLWGWPAWAEPVDDLTLMTESLPPLNFEQNGMLKGISVDLMAEMLRMVGSRLTRGDIHLMPWARAYRDILKNENTVLFLMNRNQARENLFKWVGPVINIDCVLIAKKEKGIRINSTDDLKNYRIGVIKKDFGELLMEEMGISSDNIDSVSSVEINLEKLNRGRIDLWNYETNCAKWLITRHGYNVQDYEIVYTLKKYLPAFFAFHRNTKDGIIQRFQDALDQLKTKPSETGLSKLDRIVQIYIKKDGTGIATVHPPDLLPPSNGPTTPVP
ncbi:MAG: transporter substrate-binding domain-containing protein [Thermodesulfobacteriota bacterium]